MLFKWFYTILLAQACTEKISIYGAFFFFFAGMAMLMLGRSLQICLIIFHWQHWWVLGKKISNNKYFYHQDNWRKKIPNLHFPFWMYNRFYFLVRTFNVDMVSYMYFVLFWRLSRKYFASMVDYHPPLKPLIAFVILIVFKKFPMRVPCVIFCGLTLMIAVVGASHLGVLDIPLVK